MSWTVVVPILISTLSLSVSAWTAVRNAKIQRVQSKTDLLLKIVDLRLAYVNVNRRIRRLKERPLSSISEDDLQYLLATDEIFRGQERQVDGYYRDLLTLTKYDVVTLHELRHRIEGLLKHLADDNQRLDSILESQTATERSSHAGQFNTLKQRVLHVNIMHSVPVELHALRNFFVEKNLMERPRFREFYAKWLTRTPVELGWPASNTFSSADLGEMQRELASLQL